MSSPYQSPTGFPETPKRRIWPFVFLGCAVVGLIGVAACAGLAFFGFRLVAGKEGEVAVEVDRLFEEIAQGRATEFYRTQCSAELKHTTSEKDFVSFCENVNDRLGKLESKTAVGVFVNSHNLATLVDANYDCRFQHGKGNVKIRFKRENGPWLLQAFHVESPELMKKTAREKCPNCGELYEPGAKFCPHCGAKLNDDSATEKSEPAAGE